jgi:hypothetical protein
MVPALVPLGGVNGPDIDPMLISEPPSGRHAAPVSDNSNIKVERPMRFQLEGMEVTAEGINTSPELNFLSLLQRAWFGKHVLNKNGILTTSQLDQILASWTSAD